MLHDDKLKSVVAHEESCRDGDTDPEERLDGDGGVGDVPPRCCQGIEPGGDKVTGTTFLTTTNTFRCNNKKKSTYMSLLILSTNKKAHQHPTHLLHLPLEQLV